MIDHTSLAVKDFLSALKFYDETLGHLGYNRIKTLDLPEVQVASYGIPPKSSFWISDKGPIEGEEIGNAYGVHVAFSAPSIEAIHNWYNNCLRLGGIDNGTPGPRIHYHPGYYGAFIIDPNGWRIEACLHHYQGE